MGNLASCSFIPRVVSSTRRTMSTRSASRVVFPCGEIRQFRGPVSAAEIMLECPGFFLANTRSLHMGRRFSPLGADEELQLGNLYVMFPIMRASSVVMAADMAVVFMSSTSASKRISAAKVGHIPDEAAATPNGRGGRLAVTEEDASVEGALAAAAPEFGYRLGSCRSKKPSLETIKEELPPTRRGRSR
ncbi:hypothetical protein SAY87_012900 [Trapa incisa]|uniref:Uncharacterized protein n=1 Tax=Trapa incisa TaxID=236973 RepID=A0AAN7KH09_9MYRT|nr:hypothetical protein SAY87_012900 [Trapa incisa]